MVVIQFSDNVTIALFKYNEIKYRSGPKSVTIFVRDFREKLTFLPFFFSNLSNCLKYSEKGDTFWPAAVDLTSIYPYPPTVTP